MTRVLAKSPARRSSARRLPTEDGSAPAIARWENEGGATLVLPASLSIQIRQELSERETVQAIYTADLDAEGAIRSFHSYPWAIRATVVE